MPKATAVWLVENTTLTFKQIADFCELHELEIQAIADGDVAFNIMGISPIDTNQLTWDEIRRCEASESAVLKANEMELNVRERNAKAKKVLSPSQRSDNSARGEHVADGFIRIRNVYHVPNGSPYGTMLKKVYNYIEKYGNNEKNQSRRCI